MNKTVSLILSLLVMNVVNGYSVGSKSNVGGNEADEGIYPVIEKFIADSWDSYVEKTDSLPYPYLYGLNPGTLYYWDFYFHNEGLFMQGRWDIAKNNLDNMIFQIEKLGFIPNANGWGENRSMTPVFTMGVRRFYESVPQKDKEWLRKAYDASLTEYEFWINGKGNQIEDHTTPVEGLQRYGHHADTVYLEQFFKGVVKGRFGIKEEIPREEQIAISAHRLAEAECQDFTPRFEGRCMDYIPVDLNSIIYGMEMDLAYFERELGISDGKEWEAKAKKRADLINKYCWSEERGMFMDYDFVNQRHSPIASTATFLPMKLGFATKDQSAKIVSNLDIFMSDGGVVVCEPTDDGIHYQWGYGAVWAPVQMWVMDGLIEAGYVREAKDIAGRWLRTVAANFQNPDPATHRPFKYGDGKRYPGALYEKYTRTGKINDDEYPCSVMMGWTASAFLDALSVWREQNYLPHSLR